MTRQQVDALAVGDSIVHVETGIVREIVEVQTNPDDGFVTVRAAVISEGRMVQVRRMPETFLIGDKYELNTIPEFS